LIEPNVNALALCGAFYNVEKSTNVQSLFICKFLHQKLRIVSSAMLANLVCPASATGANLDKFFEISKLWLTKL